jgi:ABC-type uncharacterized transport system involved in gliding motility auxiliary subunit
MAANPGRAARGIWKIGGGVLGLLAVLAILIGVNAIVGQMRLRKDLTEEKIYTLSRGSRVIIGKLVHPVTLKLFFSGSAPEMPEFLKTYAQQVEDLLQEFRLAGKGRIVVEKYDPKPDSDAEDLAQRYGLAGQHVGMIGPAVYFGLVAVCGDAEAAIPALDPRTDRLLEYNITRMIYRVAVPAKPVLGVLSSLPVLGTTGSPFMMPGQMPQRLPPWVAFRDLRQDYDVREIEPAAEEIPPEIDVLILVHPRNLTDKTMYALDQFVLRGGRLLAFLDPLCLLEQDASRRQPFAMPPRSSSDLEKLLKAWGLEYDAEKVAVDLNAATRVRGEGEQVEDNPLYLSLTPANTASNDIVTAQTESLLMVFAGAFSGAGSEGLTVTPILSTSEMSELTDAFTAQMGGADGARRRFKRGMKPLPLAVRLHGRFKTAFPDGRPQETPAASTNEPPAEDRAGLTESAEPTTVILVGDVDMLYDAFWCRSLNLFGYTAYEPFNDNASFFANAIEQMAGSADFANVRTRGKTSRPFTRVLALQRQAQERWVAQETMLQERLESTQRRLSELQVGKQESQRFILSPEQKKEIESFREEIQKTQQDLKQVRRNLREGIEQLGAAVKAANILLVPALVSIGGIGFALYRRARTRH